MSSDRQGIERVLDGVEILARRVRRGERVLPEVTDAVLDFLTRVVGRCRHHVKDERCDLRAEHDEERHQLQQVASKRANLAALLESYAAFVRRHLAREDDLLLPCAEHVLMVEDAGTRHGEVLRTLAQAIEAACRDAAGAAGADTPAAAVAADVMRPRGTTVQPDDTLARAAELMDAFAVRELPVVAEGKPVGIVTVRDLAPHRGHFEWTRVRTAMTPDPITVAPHTPVCSVARLLLERCFNGVPVVAEGVFVGMVTRSDLLQLLAWGG